MSVVVGNHPHSDAAPFGGGSEFLWELAVWDRRKGRRAGTGRRGDMPSGHVAGFRTSLWPAPASGWQPLRVSILAKHPCFVSRLPSCSDALPTWAEMWGTWRAMSGLSPPPPSWRQTGGAPSFPPSLHVLVTNCCQPHFAQYQQFSHLSIHQTRLEGLLILRYLGPTCLSLLFVGLE